MKMTSFWLKTLFAALLPIVSLQNEVLQPPPRSIPSAPLLCDQPFYSDSIFPLGTDYCPADFVKGIVCGLNAVRAVKGFGPLELSDEISLAALDWVTSYDPDQSFYKPNFYKYGQVAISKWTTATVGPIVFNSKNVIHKSKDTTPKIAVEGVNGTRWESYSEEQWEQTRKFGFACSTRRGAGQKNYASLVLFFESPYKAVTKEINMCKEPFPEHSYLKVNTDECPVFLTQAIICRFNEIRENKGYAPLIISEVISSAADKWASINRRSTVPFKPNYHQYGQFVAGIHWDTSSDSITYNPLDVAQNLITADFLPNISDLQRAYTESEWKNVTMLGIGCSYGPSVDGQHGKTLSVVAFFEEIAPVKTSFDFVVPSDSCPVGFAESILSGLNGMRIEQGLGSLSLNNKISSRAQQYVSSNRRLDILVKPNYLNYGQAASNFQYPQYLNKINLQISDVLAHSYLPPLFTGQLITRNYTQAEWKHTSQIGVGCSTYHGPTSNTRSVAYFAIFFNLPLLD